MALLLSKKDVADLLSVEDAIAVVEEAFRQLALGQVTMPQRTAIRMPEHHGLHLGMPAYIGGGVDALALKVVTVYPENPSKHGLPTTIGVLLLNDPTTGQPLAVMDAGFMTAVRTGAVSGVATKYLARKRARAVGVFGAGVMARWQLAAVCAVRAIDSIVVYDKDADRAASYAAEMSIRLDTPVSVVTHPKRAVENRDIVIVAYQRDRAGLRGLLAFAGTARMRSAPPPGRTGARHGHGRDPVFRITSRPARPRPATC
jgi:ornithine cyclodeaminase/alanine dehydrogenase